MVPSGVLVSTGNTIDYVYGLFAAYAAGIDFTVGREGGREQSTGSQPAVPVQDATGARLPTTHSLLRLLVLVCAMCSINSIGSGLMILTGTSSNQWLAITYQVGGGGSWAISSHPPRR